MWPWQARQVGVCGEGTVGKVSRPEMWPENGVGLFDDLFFPAKVIFLLKAKMNNWNDNCRLLIACTGSH